MQPGHQLLDDLLVRRAERALRGLHGVKNTMVLARRETTGRSAPHRFLAWDRRFADTLLEGALQRDMARLGFVVSQIREIEDARQKRLEQQPETGPHAMVRLLARIVGVGVETADMLVHEVLSRPMRDRRAVARYAGLTGSPGSATVSDLVEF